MHNVCRRNIVYLINAALYILLELLQILKEKKLLIIAF